jgi:DNA repair protein RadC
MVVARLASQLIAMEDRRPLYYDTEAIAETFREAIGSMPEERFAAIFMDKAKNQLGGMVIYEGGTTDRTILYPRNLFRDALARDATGVIICHNHPGGTLTSSPADRSLTSSLERTGDALGVTVVDQIIVTHAGWSSFRNVGLL